MVDQKEEAKIEKFIETMPTMIQTHLIICKDWVAVKDKAKVSIFTDNDLTHITDDHFEIKLIARLLDQIYDVQPPLLPPRYDDAPPGEYEYSQQSTSISSATPSAPQFPDICTHFLPFHRHKVWLHGKNFL